MDRDAQRRGGGEGEIDRSTAGTPNGVRSRVAQRDGTLAHAIQRKQGGEAGPAPTIHDAATAAVENRGSGAAVDTGVAQRVGDYLGADLSGVRVHGDPLSQEATAAMGARAFAYGSDVFLGQGERGDDLGLVAHELTHVVQQGAVGQLAAKAGQAAVMAGYFQGNIAGLRAAVDATTAAGTFDQWMTYMNASHYAAADALM